MSDTEEKLTHGAELTGLGILAAPYLHNAYKGMREGGLHGLGAGLAKDHGIAEVAGLGILAAPTAYHVGKKLFGGGKPTAPAAPKTASLFSLELIQAFAKEAAALQKVAIGPADPIARHLWRSRLLDVAAKRVATPTAEGVAKNLRQIGTGGHVGGEILNTMKTAPADSLAQRLAVAQQRKASNILLKHQELGSGPTRLPKPDGVPTMREPPALVGGKTRTTPVAQPLAAK